MHELYGSLFFIGIFLGAMFFVATIMIIYYKQISEGYEDRKRFQIMQKVGMDKSEVKKTIRSQILSVFFIPIVVAVIHIVFAFNIIRELLKLFYLKNLLLFVITTIGVVIIFFLAYTVVYSITAKAYYKIVDTK